MPVLSSAMLTVLTATVRCSTESVALYTTPIAPRPSRSEEHTSELQSRGHLVCRLLLEKKKNFLKVRCRLALLPFLISCLIFFLLVPSPPIFTLFPYTTLFRSRNCRCRCFRAPC